MGSGSPLRSEPFGPSPAPITRICWALCLKAPRFFGRCVVTQSVVCSSLRPRLLGLSADRTRNAYTTPEDCRKIPTQARPMCDVARNPNTSNYV